MAFASPILTHKHYLLLLAYRIERSKSQAQRAISYEAGEHLNMGKHVLPHTQELIALGFIQRTNPNEPRVRGHKHLITSEGKHELERYFDKLQSISRPNPAFGY